MVANDIIVRISAVTAGLTAGIKTAKSQVASLSSTATVSAATMSRNVSESMRRMGNTLVGAAGSAMIGFVHPIVSGFQDIITAGMEMEDSIQRVMSVFDNIETPAAFAQTKSDLEDFISGLAGTTKFDFGEISDSIYNMAQAGKDFNDITELTPHILELATAQMSDVDTTGELVISTMNAYKFGMEDASRVTNAFAAANSATLLTMSDMAVSAQYVNSVFSSMWGSESFEQGLAVTGMLKDMGYTGQKAGRIVRDIFLSLMNPSAEVSRILERNNINIYKNSDAINQLKGAYEGAEKKLEDMKISGSATTAEIAEQSIEVQNLKYELENTYATGLKSFDEVMQEFARAKKDGLTLGEIFAFGGKQSGGAFAAMIDDLPKLNEYTEAITDTNEATRQAEIINESTAAKIGFLRSSVAQLKKDLYDSLIEPLSEVAVKLTEAMPKISEIGELFVTKIGDNLVIVVDKIIGLVNWFDNLDSGTKNLIATLVGTVTTIGVIITPFMLLGGIISWNISSILTLGGHILNLPSIVSSSFTSISGVIKNFKTANKGGMASAVFGDNIGEKFKKNKEYFDKFDFSLKNIFGKLGKLDIYLTAAIDKSLLFGKALGTNVVGKITGIPEKITNISDGIWKFDNAAKNSGNTLGFLKDSIKKVATKIPLLGGVMTSFSGLTMATVIPAILTVITTIGPLILIIGALIGATILLYTAIRDNWQGIGDFVGGAVEYIMGLLEPFLDAIDNVKNAMGNLFEAIKGGTASDIIGGLGEIIGSVVRFIGSIPYTILTTLGTIIGDAARIIGDWLGQVGKDVADKGIGQFLYEIAISIINGAIEMGASFVDGFIKGVTGASAEDKVADSISDSEKMESKGISDGTNYADGLNQGISDNIKTLAEIKAEKKAEMMDKDVITDLDRPETLDPLLQAQIADIRSTAYAQAASKGVKGFHAPSYAEAQKRAEEQGIEIGEAMYQMNQEYSDANRAYQDKLIADLKSLYLSRFDEQQMMNSAGKVAHEGGYGYEQWSISDEDYIPVASDNATTIVESTATQIETQSADRMTEVGKTISNDVGNGIVENQKVYKEKVDTIYTDTETTMTQLSTSAYGWGSQFVSSLNSGIMSQYSNFTSTIDMLKSQMMGLQFIANPETATNAGLMDTLTQLNMSISRLATGGGGEYNISINISDITLKEEISADELANIVSDEFETKINTLNRRVTI
jgi:TP901 family phage tail tape measure protein